jgi:outer membrane immunogenic protein
MRTIFIATILAATAATVATPASAQGFRAEIHSGADRIQGGGDHDDGIAYGFGIGYDHQVSNKLLLGLEANFEDSTVKECATTGTGSTAVKTCGSLGRDLNVNARLGYKISDRGTLYALAGYTNLRTKASVTTGIGDPVKSAVNLDGFRVGAGYEHGISDRIFLKGEYRYSNYEGGADRHQLMAGLGVRF